MPDDITIGSLFAGIGGFELAAARTGLRTAWSAEIDPQCREVLTRHPLAALQHAPAIAYTLEARHHPQAVAYRTSGNCGATVQGDKTAALNCNTDPPQQIVQSRYGVRRLTPRECERLQGFPDDWTRYDSRGKELSDSARYRMIGNSVAVPCVEWILRRISQAITEAT